MAKRSKKDEDEFEDIDEIESELKDIESEIDSDNKEDEEEDLDTFEKERREYMKKNNIKETNLFEPEEKD
jgi:hypothetical protein